MPTTNIVYNDNKACVDWSKSSTTKGLRHIQMKENRVRENIGKRFVTITHVNGKVSLADPFTKEMKDTSHFVELCDIMMCHLFCSLRFSLFLQPFFSLKGGVSGIFKFKE